MKELTKTPFIEGLLSAVAGPDVDMNKLHVFEVRATSTVQLRGKKGTIFENGEISPNTISQLARKINDDAIPLMMDHDMKGTPYGKFFYAESVAMDDGHIELRGYMYVDGSEERILAKLESASIDEVSIQFASEHLLCSECNFDYLAAAENEDFMPLITRTCDEGHAVGKDGVHVRLVGAKEVVELSMVSRGAAKNSKIIGSSDAMLGESAQRLAASGVDVFNNYYCTASVNDDIKGVTNVDLKELMTKLTALTDDKVSLSTDLNVANALVATLTTERDDAVTRAEAAEAEVTRLAAEAEAAETAEEAIAPETLVALTAHVGKTYVALKALDGDTEATAPDDLAEAMKFIDENQARLSALIPVDGVSHASGTSGDDLSEAQKRDQLATLAAYKTK